MKFNIPTALIIFLLGISLFVRISKLEYPLIHTSKWGDGTRDYLVAHYIKSYGERPLLGPFNLLFDTGFRNSPLYYYLLAVFLIPYDSVMTLSFINILFQLITISILYLLTKAVFDGRCALIAALLFSFTPEVLRQSEYIWQPTIMQSFAYFSLYLLVLAYFKKSYKMLFTSLVFLNIAASLHNSLLSWFPQFLLLSFLIVKLERKSFKYYLGIFIAFFSSLIFLYVPTFLYFLNKGFRVSEGVGYIKTQGTYLNSPANYFGNLSYNFSQIWQVFSVDKLFILSLVVAVIAYLFLQKNNKRYFLLLAILFFLEPIFISSFFNKNQLHYLTVCFGMFTIIISVILNFFVDKLTGKHFLRAPLLLISVLLTFKITSSDFYFLYPDKNLSESKLLISSAASSIEREVLKIQREEKLNHPDFFQVISFAFNNTNFPYPTLDTIFLIPLEKNLNYKLAKVSDDSPFNLLQVNNNKYIFVSCFEFDLLNMVRDCSREFLSFYPNYSIVKNVYTIYPIRISLAKRN